MDCNPDGSAERSNMAAVGSMEPGIEVWNLDVVDSVEPAATLGGEQQKTTPSLSEPSANESSGKKAAKKKVHFMLLLLFVLISSVTFS
jgi:periodic tryptophan protein 1